MYKNNGGNQKSKFRVSILMVIFFLVLLATGCSPTAPPKKDKPLEVVIPDTTKVLDNKARSELLEFHKDGSLVFLGSSLFPSNLKKDDVVVSEPSKAAPFGFLRKVTKIKNVSGQIIVETTTARLKDAVHQGEFAVHKNLSPGDLSSSKALLDGISLSTINTPNSLITTASDISTQAQSFVIDLNDVVLYDLDGNESTTNDQVRSTGKIIITPPYFDFGGGMRIKVSYDPPFDVDVDIQTKFEAIMGFNEKLDNLGILASAGVSLNKSVELASYSFDLITFFIGPVPVVLAPRLVVTLGVNGEVSSEISFSVDQEFGIKFGAEKPYGQGFDTVSKKTDTFSYNTSGLEPRSIGVTFNVKPKAGIRGDILLYGIVGPSLGVDIFTRFEGRIPSKPTWKLYGGAAANVGIQVPVLDYSWNKEIFSFEKLIAQDKTNAPPVIKSISPKNGSQVGLNLPVPLSVEAYDLEDESFKLKQTWLSNIDGNLGTGLSVKAVFKTAGKRTLIVEVTDSDGAKVVETSTITVVNSPPDLTLSQPRATDLIQIVGYFLVGSALDQNVIANGGRVNCKYFKWTSSNPNDKITMAKCDDKNPLAAGQIAFKPGDTGKRTLTLVVNDPDEPNNANLRDKESVTIDVKACQGNCSAIATIIKPQEGDVIPWYDSLPFEGLIADNDSPIQSYQLKAIIEPDTPQEKVLLLKSGSVFNLSTSAQTVKFDDLLIANTLCNGGGDHKVRLEFIVSTAQKQTRMLQCTIEPPK